MHCQVPTSIYNDKYVEQSNSEASCNQMGTLEMFAPNIDMLLPLNRKLTVIHVTFVSVLNTSRVGFSICIYFHLMTSFEVFLLLEFHRLE